MADQVLPADHTVALSLPSGSLSLERVRVVGILNVTPDSFYDGGRYVRPDNARQRAAQMAEEGADVIEIGGEKAGPGEPVAPEEEMRRVIPMISAVKRELELPVSVDTFKPEVARAAMEAGADIINSIDGMASLHMRQVAASTGAAVVVMHIQGRPRVANPNPQYTDVVAEVRDGLLERVKRCLDEGVEEHRIIIDPGPGFGKSTEHDLAVIRHLEVLSSLPYPVMLAVSRKKFIGEVLGLPVDQRLEGSLAVTAWGVLQGARLVRAHDVRAVKRVVTMTEAVVHPELVEP